MLLPSGENWVKKEKLVFANNIIHLNNIYIVINM